MDLLSSFGTKKRPNNIPQMVIWWKNHHGRKSAKITFNNSNFQRRWKNHINLLATGLIVETPSIWAQRHLPPFWKGPNGQKWTWTLNYLLLWNQSGIKNLSSDSLVHHFFSNCRPNLDVDRVARRPSQSFASWEELHLQKDLEMNDYVPGVCM